MPRPLAFTIQSEFPDYPIASLPSIPKSWADRSWRNDTCPCWQTGHWLVWIDWPDHLDRDVPGGSRFMVCRVDNEGVLIDESVALETDDWDDVLCFVL